MNNSDIDDTNDHDYKKMFNRVINNKFYDEYYPFKRDGNIIYYSQEDLITHIPQHNIMVLFSVNALQKYDFKYRSPYVTIKYRHSHLKEYFKFLDKKQQKIITIWIGHMNKI